QAPQAGPAPLVLPVAYMEGEQRDPAGNLISITKATIEVSPMPPARLAQPAPPVQPPAPTLVPNLAAAFIYGIGSATFGFDTDTGTTTGAFNASGQLVRADIGGSLYTLEAGGTHADFGTDGILTWGRWIGPVTLPTGSTETYNANQGFHYVVGLPTAVLPTNGVIANYVLSGASRPTYVDGTIGPGTFNGSLSVTFGAQAAINGTFQAAMPDRTFNWTAVGSTTTSSFSLASTPTPGSCQTACTITTSGFFAGPNAERAGLGYSIEDTKTVVGAAAFKKQ